MKKHVLFLLLCFLISVSLVAQDKLAKGTKVKILEIAQTDSYYDERAEFVGKDATALGEITKNSDGFYSGTLETSGGRTCFFTKVKLSATAKSTVSSKSDFEAGSTIPSGTRFVVLEVPESDAYYSDKKEIEKQTGTTTSSLSVDEDGYVGGSIDLDNGKNYYFYKVKLGKSTSVAPAKTTKTTEEKNKKEPVFITGTIKSGTTVYVAEISSEDSYYDDRFEKVGQKGKIGKNDLSMKEDGWYSGDFTYDDGSTAYFYKVKFSKEPVEKLVNTGATGNSKSSEDDMDWSYDKTSNASTTADPEGERSWKIAKNDIDIKEGDKVEITALSPEDSYYEDKDEYIGKQGIAGDDLEYDADNDGYGGSVKLDDEDKPYFYLVKLKKLSKGSSTKSTSSSVSSTTTIPKGTKVMVLSLAEDDSYYSSKEKYLRKSGKVAEGLNQQKEDYYSGKILFDDGTDAYFYMVKVKIIK